MNGFFKKENKKPAETQDKRSIVKLSALAESLNSLQESIEKPVSVENFDEVKLHLRKELGILAKMIQSIVSSINIPNSIKVTGVPSFPDSIGINGLNIRIAAFEQLVDKMDEISSLLSAIEFKPNITVEPPEIPEIKIPPINVPEIKIPPINVPKPEVIVNSDIDLSELLGALKPLKHLSNRANKPLSVRLSDGVKFIKALQDVVGKQEKWVTAFSQSKGMDEDEFVNKYKLLTQATTIVSGRKAISAAGTAEKLIAASTPCFRVDISADTGNAGTPVVIGGSNVVALEGSQVGTVIIPGNPPHIILIDDVSKIYADVGTNGDAVLFTYYTR